MSAHPPVSLPFQVPHRIKLFLAYLAVYVVWGSTYFAISVVVKDIPPMHAAGLRYTCAGLLLLGWCLFRRESLPVGLFLLVLTNGTTTIACRIIPSSIVALLQATGPAWVIFWDSCFFHKETYRRRHYLGICMGICGVAMLVLARGGSGASFLIKPAGVALVMFGASCWAFGNLLGKGIPSPSSSLMNSALAMCFAGPTMFFLGNLGWGNAMPAISAMPLTAFLGLAYLVLFGSIVAFTSHCWLMQVEPPSRVATSTFVNPAIAMLLGVAFGGEALTFQMFAGAAVIMFSVLLVWKR